MPLCMSAVKTRKYIDLNGNYWKRTGSGKIQIDLHHTHWNSLNYLERRTFFKTWTSIQRFSDGGCCSVCIMWEKLSQCHRQYRSHSMTRHRRNSANQWTIIHAIHVVTYFWSARRWVRLSIDILQRNVDSVIAYRYHQLFSHFILSHDLFIILCRIKRKWSKQYTFVSFWPT